MKKVSAKIMKRLIEDIGLDSKVDEFNNILCQWDFIQEWTHTDITEPHIECIEVNGNKIHVECELWDPDLDDYVFCDGGDYEAPNVIELLNKADFYKSYNVYEEAKPIYDSISALIDWNRVSDVLYDLRDSELNHIESSKDQ